ncbi:MAG TPA: type II toxin-antitoxin system VapC family toxin [Humisphaera sp.]|nr:type II toxin-antitoxin system VapC family toxin [Humisphaera sp.]
MLDTNALSAMADRDKALEHCLGSAPTLALPVIVLGEYRYGIRNSRHRATYESWLNERLSFFEVLPIETATAETYAELRHELRALGKPVPENDLWIAALARQYSLTIVSRDRHFTSIPKVRLLSW